MPAYTPITPPNRIIQRQVSTKSWWKGTLKRLNPNAYTFLIPFFIIFLIFRIYPFLLGVYTSFTNARVGPRPPKFIGFENYFEVLSSSEVGRAFFVTAHYTILVVPMTFFIALAMAVYVNARFPAHTISRFVFFAPFVLTASIVAIIWNWMFQTQFGLVNVTMDMIGLASRTAWLKETYLVLPVIAFISSWWVAGFSMVIFLAALQNIPGDLNEAARIDGANSWQIFWRVTFPLLLPASTLVITVSIIEAMRVFSIIHIITVGGPSDYSTSVVFYIYQEGFVRYEQGMASAIGVVLFLVIMILTILRFSLLRGDQKYY
jgi:ABC-type sugar transport system permease subunit